MISILKKIISVETKMILKGLLYRELPVAINKVKIIRTKKLLEKKMQYFDHHSFNINQTLFLKSYSRILNYSKTKDYVDQFLIQVFLLKYHNKENKVKLSDLKDGFTKLLNKIKPSSLDTNQWISLYFLVNDMGFFILANKLRQKAIDRTLEYSLDDLKYPFNAMHLFNCYMELGNYESAQNLILKITQTKYKYVYPLKKMRLYFDLFKSTNKNNYKISENNLSYHNLVHNSRLAVVSPAPTNSINGREIDNHDLVVRINFNDLNRKKSDEKKGNKVDISYYVQPIIQNILKNNVKILNKLKYVVFKSSETRKISKALKKSNIKSRELIYFPFEFVGSWNMIQNIVLDLLIYKPSKLKIFNTKFYSSNTEYSSSYSHQIGISSKILSYHNQITQIQLIRNLYKLSVIQLDSDTLEVINLDNNEYLRRLESIYHQ